MRPLLNVILTTGMLVVIPVGLRLVALPGTPPGKPPGTLSGRLSGRLPGTPRGNLLRLWWLGAVPGAVSLWMERGTWAAVVALPYAAATVCLVLWGLLRLGSRRSLAPGEIAVLTALATPAVAATALVAERLGHSLWGFSPGVLALTVAHFHFAGFAAALVAGLVCRAAGDGPQARAAALSVPAGTLLVLGGYFVGDWFELVGAVVLTAGMWLVGGLTLAEARRSGPDRLTRVLLGVSALVLTVSMVLALSWALGEATGLPHLPVSWMVATHGLLNAFGFALCALCAWRRLRPEPL
ncbi:YndJ family protein [Streptosporangium carneum]|uniref:YndJ-like protein n=1 Tax=Streptosporangium carneum TaxID=47481 RepID=A0A9W6MFR7_9ACTN|nr:YndJ family protein [Streptosporangium carneum]GLK12163.1 hypothetical protein GCM10017600_55710 [Streptosporangium carneum]